jgi:hypothetical protein
MKGVPASSTLSDAFRIGSTFRHGNAGETPSTGKEVSMLNIGPRELYCTLTEEEAFDRLGPEEAD